MKFVKTALAFAALGVGALEVAPVKNHSVHVPPVSPLKNHSVPVPPVSNRTAVADVHKVAEAPVTKKDVQVLRNKLEKMESGLEAMLPAMKASKIGPELKTFVVELHNVLQETKDMKDNAAAMRKLEAARAGVNELTRDLTSRQVSIMKDEESQKDSLLLGVLMTRQKEPMAEQIKLLTSKDFGSLPVSKALLAKHNASTPLFAQAAAYLDTHAVKGIKVQARSEADRKADATAMAARLQKSVDSLQKVYDARVKSHAKREEELKQDVKKETKKKSKHVLQAISKREERNFKKWAAMQKHDIDAMKEAVAAVKKGDISALNKARAALQQSMSALKDKNSGFLVLLSLGHKLMERDCPYCVAQCVGTCHQEGKPYAQCMTSCADAGK